jgi:hypothetical protein
LEQGWWRHRLARRPAPEPDALEEQPEVELPMLEVVSVAAEIE